MTTYRAHPAFYALCTVFALFVGTAGVVGLGHGEWYSGFFCVALAAAFLGSCWGYSLRVDAGGIATRIFWIFHREIPWHEVTDHSDNPRAIRIVDTSGRLTVISPWLMRPSDMVSIRTHITVGLAERNPVLEP